MPFLSWGGWTWKSKHRPEKGRGRLAGFFGPCGGTHCAVGPSLARGDDADCHRPAYQCRTGDPGDPEGMEKLGEVVIMGGAVRTRGNITPAAEFNFYADPMASQIVLESGLPITLVPLDVTHQVFLHPQIMEERLKLIEDPFSRFVVEATGYDFIKRQFRPRAKVYHLHDPLAVGAVIDRTIVKKEKLALQVEVEEGSFMAGFPRHKGSQPPKYVWK